MERAQKRARVAEDSNARLLGIRGISDAVFVVCRFLCYTDAMALFATCPALFRGCAPDFAAVISARLREDGFEDPEQLFRALRESGALLSGSFVLSCMMGPVDDDGGFVPGDIDVVVARHRKPTLRALFPMDDVLNYPHEPGANAPAKHDYIPQLDMGSTRYRPKGWWRIAAKKADVKIMHLDVIDCAVAPSAFIAQYFDLGFCKLAFDGTRLRVADWANVFARADTIDLRHWISVASDLGGHNYHVRHDVFAKLANRVAKYRKRGFAVALDLGDPPVSYRRDFCSPAPKNDAWFPSGGIERAMADCVIQSIFARSSEREAEAVNDCRRLVAAVAARNSSPVFTRSTVWSILGDSSDASWRDAFAGEIDSFWGKVEQRQAHFITVGSQS